MVTQYIERARQYQQEHGIKLKCLCMLDYPNFRYWIDRNGNVYSFVRDQPLKKYQEDNGQGYLRVEIHRTKYYVHRLVAQHFLLNDDEENKTIVHHIDGNKQNNTCDNLVWLTPEEHKARHKILNKWKRNTIKFDSLTQNTQIDIQ